DQQHDPQHLDREKDRHRVVKPDRPVSQRFHAVFTTSSRISRPKRRARHRRIPSRRSSSTRSEGGDAASVSSIQPGKTTPTWSPSSRPFPSRQAFSRSSRSLASRDGGL